MPQLSDRTPSSPMLVELTQHYSSTSWRDSNCWEKDRRIWNDVGQASPKSSCTLSPHLANDGNVDKVLYQNLVEMIPLVESLMDKNKTITRQASLVHTPAPSRDWQSKKADESSAKGRKARQLFSNNRGEMTNGFLPGDSEDAQSNDSRKDHPEEIQMLQISSDVTKNFVSKAEMYQLQSQLDQLEQKLQEKNAQIQSEEFSLKQVDFLQMKLKVEELEKEIHEKDQQVRNTQAQLIEKQFVIADLQCLVKKMESDILESGKKASETENELISLRLQVATHNFMIEKIAALSACGDELDSCSSTEDVAADDLSCKEQVVQPEMAKKEIKDMEIMQRKYMAAIIAAKENPGEELLSLVAELRAELQKSVIQTPYTFITSRTDSS